MKTLFTRYRVAVIVAVCSAFAAPAAASASATYDLSGVSSNFTAQVLNAVTTALPIGAAIMALFVGWRVIRRLTKG